MDKISVLIFFLFSPILHKNKKEVFQNETKYPQLQYFRVFVYLLQTSSKVFIYVFEDFLFT